MEGRLRITPTCTIGLDEVEGGSTGRAVPAASTPTPATAAPRSVSTWRRHPRLRQRASGSGAPRPDEVAAASDSRSQASNRELALERPSKLADGLRVERPRRPTQPVAAARERRLEHKRRRSQRKRERRRPGPGRLIPVDPPIDVAGSSPASRCSCSWWTRRCARSYCWRGVATMLTRAVFVSVRACFNVAARWAKTWSRRDRVMALYAPVVVARAPDHVARARGARLHRHVPRSTCACSSAPSR